MKKIWIMLILILIPTCSFCEEWILSKKRIEFGCDCQLDESEIVSKLKGECGGKEFWLTQKGIKEVNKNPSAYILSSWQAFDQFKGHFFSSPSFDTISKEFFNSYNLGLVYVMYTGSQFIKNDGLYQTDRECGLSYEIWDQKLNAFPACTWSVLYLVKLKK